MTLAPTVTRGYAVRAIVLDVEGTTTPVRFVKDTLFPFARARLALWIAEHGDEPETRAACEALAAYRDEADADLASTALRLADADQKVTALKALQGLVWEAGYRDGAIVAPLYPDVAAALARWHEAGATLAIFSSGSVRAQQLLFRHTDAGDLTPQLTAYFDTTTGAKNAPTAYTAIAATLDIPPGEVLFLSDIRAELVAARAAGVHALGVAREADVPPPESDAIRSFETLDILVLRR